MYCISWCIMLFLTILILNFISRGNSLGLTMAKNSKNYGPYNVKFYNYKLCSGPRSKNVTITSSSLKTDQQGYVRTFNCSFIMQVKVEELKTSVWSIKGEKKDILWNYKLKPCQHFFIAGMMQQQFRNMHNCVVPQDDYYFESNFTENVYRFLGDSFFYGDYMFKVNTIAKEGNVICNQFNILFSKK